MSNYINEIIGQESAKNILEKLIDNSKIPHAFLFQGLDGIGKELIAIRFAQALNKKFGERNTNNAAISQIAKLSEPYIKYIFPLPRGKNETDASSPLEKLSQDDIQLIQEELNKKISNPFYKIKLPKTQNIKISSIRDIKKFLSLNYDDIKYRVILISDAHLMNEATQNALLKNLEEPPSGVIFILITPYPALLRETIRSRCWVVNFYPLSNNEIKEVLINYYSIENSLAESVAPFAGGSVASALTSIDNDFDLLKEKTILILRYSFGRKYHSALNEFSSIISDGNSETIKILIQMIITWLNDVQKFKYGEDNFFFKDYKETLEKFNNRFPYIELNEIVTELDNLTAVFKNNVNLNTVILALIFKLASLTSPQIKA
jgi:DNA polymerase III subunit delta'